MIGFRRSRSTTWIGDQAHCHTLFPGGRENRIVAAGTSTAVRGHDSATAARFVPWERSTSARTVTVSQPSKATKEGASPRRSRSSPPTRSPSGPRRSGR